MGEFSPIHWMIVLAIILLLFGGRKIPELAKVWAKASATSKRACLALRTTQRLRHSKPPLLPTSLPKKRKPSLPFKYLV